MHGDAAATARRQCSTPARLVGGEFQHAQVARMIAQQGAAKLERILCSGGGQLIDKGLHGEGRVRGTHRAPPLHRYRDLGGMQVNGDVGYGIG